MKITIDGSEIAYQDEGRGPTLLLLHAFPLGLSMWEPQVAALRSRHRLVRFDVRGFGGSPLGGERLTIERIADDAAALLERLGVERATLLGCSMGGYASFAFLRRHPSRLAGLALLDTRAAADSDETRRGRSVLAERVRTEGSAALVEAMLPRLLGVTSQRERPALVAQVRDQIRAVTPPAAAAALAALAARADATATLAAIRVPTLVMAGAEDVVTPPAEAEALAAAIPHGRYLSIPRAGHLAGLENPAAVNDALAEFLAEAHR